MMIRSIIRQRMVTHWAHLVWQARQLCYILALLALAEVTGTSLGQAFEGAALKGNRPYTRETAPGGW